MTRKLLTVFALLLIAACTQQAPTVEVNVPERHYREPLIVPGAHTCAETRQLESADYTGGPVLLYCSYAEPFELAPTEGTFVRPQVD